MLWMRDVKKNEKEAVKHKANRRPLERQKKSKEKKFWEDDWNLQSSIDDLGITESEIG